MVGGVSTLNELALVAVPPGVVTLSGPVVAPAGTVVWTAVSEVTVKVALVPLNATAVAPVKPDPLIVTLVPTGPLVGVKLAIVGGRGAPFGAPPSQPMKVKAGVKASIPTSPAGKEPPQVKVNWGPPVWDTSRNVSDAGQRPL